jgi:hypothetical protein
MMENNFTKPIRYDMNHPFLSREFLLSSTSFYDKAEELAGDEKVLERVQRDRLPVTYVKLMRGPAFVGDEYIKELDRFEKTAKILGLTHLREGGSQQDVDNKIALWRKQWTEYTTTK